MCCFKQMYYMRKLSKGVCYCTFLYLDFGFTADDLVFEPLQQKEYEQLAREAHARACLPACS